MTSRDALSARDFARVSLSLLWDCQGSGEDGLPGEGERNVAATLAEGQWSPIGWSSPGDLAGHCNFRAAAPTCRHTYEIICEQTRDCLAPFTPQRECSDLDIITERFPGWPG